MLKRTINRSKSISIIVAFVMIMTQVSGIFTTMIQANEDITLKNEFIKVEINDANGRYSIGSMEGSIARDDSNASMLFDEYEPETTFTTFKIDGEEYIFGNDYGFLGDGGYFTTLPSNNNIAIEDGFINSCTWVINGVEIQQQLEVTDTEQNAGNVKISYLVNNKSGADIEIGSRILLDTMLGSNDGAPIKVAGSSAFVQTERRFSGEDVPLYWNAYAGHDALDMMTYGILEGWQDLYTLEGRDDEYASTPDELVVAHWYSLSDTKWDFTPNELLDFTSENNAYGTGDSAVAMYWNPDTLAAGEERLYETYYGLGQYATAEKRQLLDFKVYAPTEVEVLEDNTDYAEDTITIAGEVSHRFIEGEDLENASVTIMYYGGGFRRTPGQSTTIELGDVEANNLRNFEWRFETEGVTSWETFEYKVYLNADNLDETLVRRGNIMVPPIHGAVPEIQIETIAPANIYYADEDNQIIIKGHGLDALKYMDAFDIYLTRPEVLNEDGSVKTPENIISLNEAKMTIEHDHVLAKLDNTLTTEDLGVYDVTIDYRDGEIILQRVFEQGFNISDDSKYSKKFYSILLVVRSQNENGKYKYSIVPANDESELDYYSSNEILLEIRGPKIYDIDGIYYIDGARNTINSILTIDNRLTVPMVLYKDGYGDITFEGIGGLFIDVVPFAYCPFSIYFDSSYAYSTSEWEKENYSKFKDVVLEVQDLENMYQVDTDDLDEFMSIITGAIDNSLFSISTNNKVEGFPVDISGAVLEKDSIAFAGEVDLGAVIDYGKSQLTLLDDLVFDPDLAVGVNELSFIRENEKVTFQRFSFFGGIGLETNAFSDIIPLLTLDQSAQANVNGYIDKDRYEVSIDAGVELSIISGNGKFAMRSVMYEGIRYPILDEISVTAGTFDNDFLTFNGSGSFKTIWDPSYSDLITGTKIVIDGSAKLLTMPSGRSLGSTSAHLHVKNEGMEIKMDELRLASLSFLKSVEFSIKEVNEKLIVSGGGAVNLANVIKGSANLTFREDGSSVGPFRPNSLTGSGLVKLQVPNSIPVVGGMGFPGTTVGFNNQKIYCKVPITVNLIFFSVTKRINVNIYWSTFGLASLEAQVAHLDSDLLEPIFDDQGELVGYMDFGSSFDLKYNSNANNTLASTEEFSEAISTISNLEHILSMNDFELGVIQVKPEGDMPELSLTDPNGDEYRLEEGTTYTTRNVGDQLYIDIMVGEPMNGNWTLTSSEEVSVKLYDFIDSADITSATAGINDNQLNVNWEGELLEDTFINVNLVNNQEGTNSFTAINSEVNAEDGELTVDIPESLTSGEYFVDLTLVNSDGENADIYRVVEPIEYIDSHAPEGITNLQVFNGGNASILVNWEEEGSSDGAYVTVYDVDTMELISEENIAQGVYEYELGRSITGESSGLLKEGSDYLVTVGSYNMYQESLRMAPLVSETITINEVAEALVDFSFSNDNDSVLNHGLLDGLETYTSRDNGVVIKLTSDEAVELVVKQDNASVFVESGMEFEVLLTLVEGDNGISIVGTKSNGDKTMNSFNMICDTNEPVLFVEQPLQGSVQTEDFILSGYVESVENVSLNGEKLPIEQNGTFNKLIALEDQISQTMTIVASDLAGNEGVYICEVFNGNILESKNIKIVPATNQVVIGEKVDYDVALVDSGDNEYLIDDKLIEWSILSSDGLVSINDEGIVTGEVVGFETIVASYALSDDYVLDDGHLIEVVTEIKETKFIESSPDLIGLGIDEEYQIDTYESYDDQSKRIIEPSMLDYTILTGTSSVSVDKDGLVTTLGEGKSILRVSYDKHDITYESYLIIIVSKDNIETNLGRLSEEDLFIINALEGVIRQEQKRKHQILVEAIATSNGVSSIVLPESFIDLAFAQEEVDNNGGKSIYIELPSIVGTIEYQVTIKKEALGTSNRDVIVIETYLGNLRIPTDILEGVELLDEQVTITIREVIYEGTDPLIGDRPVVDIKLYKGPGISGEEVQVINGESYIEAELDYSIKSDEEARYVGAGVVESEDTLDLLPMTIYDETTGMLVIRTMEFGRFGVTYNEVAFEDLESCKWSEEAVESLASKGIISDTPSSFNPYTSVESQDLYMWLEKALNWTPTEALEINLDNQYVTRETMMSLISEAYRDVNKESYSSETALPTQYNDIKEISEEAKADVIYMIEKGFIKGSANSLIPGKEATKAETAITIYRILKELK